MQPDFTATDTGCYADSARGIYQVDEIVALAEQCGFDAEHSDACAAEHATTFFASRFAGCPDAYEIADAAESYLQERTAEGLIWGSIDGGDWGLWSAPSEEEE